MKSPFKAQPLKITYVASSLQSCGPTLQLYNLITHLDRKKFSPSIITLSPEPPGSMRASFEQLNLPISCLELGRISTLVYGKKKFQRALKNFLPNIIHSQGFRADIISSWWSGIPSRVITQRNYPLLDYPSKFGPTLGAAAGKLHLRILRQSPAVVACSEAIKTALQRHDVNTTAIRNGVMVRENLVPESERKAIRKSLGLPTENPLWITAGSFYSIKNNVETIKAFKKALYKSSANNSHLVMLGDGPLLSAAKVEAKEISDRVHFPGHVQNVLQYLNCCDVFVSASSTEGLPNTVLEALERGLPVLLSDIPPHKEIYDLNPKVGRLFPLDDFNVLAMEFSRPMAGWSEARVEARELAVQKLSAEVMSQSYQYLYTQLVKR